MSQIWSYDTFLPSNVLLSIEDMITIYELLDESGFSVINPVTKDIEVFRLNPSDLEIVTLKFKSWDDLLGENQIVGNKLVIWKGEVDAYIEFNSERDKAEKYMDVMPIKIIRHGSLSLSIDNTHYRADETNRKAVADAVRKVFLGLCDYFDCRYGLSYNEETIEIIQVPPKQFHYAMFWLNYFSRDILKNINLKRIKQIGGTIHHTKNGGIIEFSSYPWERSLASLVKINERWQQRNDG